VWSQLVLRLANRPCCRRSLARLLALLGHLPLASTHTHTHTHTLYSHSSACVCVFVCAWSCFSVGISTRQPHPGSQDLESRSAPIRLASCAAHFGRPPPPFVPPLPLPPTSLMFCACFCVGSWTQHRPQGRRGSVEGGFGAVLDLFKLFCDSVIGLCAPNPPALAASQWEPCTCLVSLELGICPPGNHTPPSPGRAALA